MRRSTSIYPARKGLSLFAQFITLGQAAAQLLRESIRRNFCAVPRMFLGGLDINDGRER